MFGLASFLFKKSIPMLKFYHISDNFLGKTIRFKPRVPSNRHTANLNSHKYMGYDENICCNLMEDKKIKRICVSNSIKGAIHAVGERDTYFHVYAPKEIYSITRDLPKLLVPDAKDTGEHWILSPTTFYYIGEVYVREYKEYHREYTEWKWVKNKL